LIKKITQCKLRHLSPKFDIHLGCNKKIGKSILLSRTQNGNVIVFDMKCPCEMEIQPCTN